MEPRACAERSVRSWDCPPRAHNMPSRLAAGVEHCGFFSPALTDRERHRYNTVQGPMSISTFAAKWVACAHIGSRRCGCVQHCETQWIPVHPERTETISFVTSKRAAIGSAAAAPSRSEYDRPRRKHHLGSACGLTSQWRAPQLDPPSPFLQLTARGTSLRMHWGYHAGV